MKNLFTKKALSAFAVLFAFTYASAQKFKADGLYYNILSTEEKTVEVVYDDSYETWTSVEIPEHVTYGGETYTVTSIGGAAFYQCDLQTIKMPETLTLIDDYAFQGNYNMTKLDIPNSVTRIGFGAFDCCNSLTSIKYPVSLQVIEGGAFHLCYALTSIDLPEALDSIGEAAFGSCHNLTSVVIPNSVTKIAYSAFQQCIKLTSVTIGSSVKEIEYSAFADCPMTSVYCLAQNPPTIPSYSTLPLFDENVYTDATLYVPKGCKADYESADEWSKFTNIVEMEPTGISGTETASGISISTDDGSITVNGAGENSTLSVYSLDGTQVYDGTGPTVSNLPSGVYVVKACGRTFKVAL